MLNKPFFKRSDFYVAVAVPYLATLVQSIHAEITSGHLNPNDPLFILLVKVSTFLSGVYAAGRALQYTFGTPPAAAKATPEVSAVATSGIQ